MANFSAVKIAGITTLTGILSAGTAPPDGTTVTFDFFGVVAAVAARDLVVAGRVVSGIGVRPLTGAVAIQTPVHYFV